MAVVNEIFTLNQETIKSVKIQLYFLNINNQTIKQKQQRKFNICLIIATLSII